jgi:phosphatidylglycerophosphatase A
MALEHPSWLRTWPTSLVVNLATLGAIGRKLPAPGTWGSLVGIAYAAAVVPRCGTVGTILITLVVSYLAVGLCGEAEVRLGKQDPGEVILDEFVAMPLCFLGWPALVATGWPVWAIFAAGFGLFRFFDILKPLGISRLQALPAGWGVVVDDLAAALAACATLQAAVLVWTLLR